MNEYNITVNVNVNYIVVISISVSQETGACHPLIILAAGLRPVRTGGEASGDTPHPGRGETPAPRVMSGCQTGAPFYRLPGATTRGGGTCSALSPARLTPFQSGLLRMG